MIGSTPQKVSTAYVLLTLTALFWAGNWVIARGMQGYMSPIAMAFWRWFAALMILLPFVARPIYREWPAVRASWKTILGLAVLGVAGFNTLTYTGLKYTAATNGVLLNSVIPIIIIAINAVFLKERIGARQALGVAISLTGVATIVARGEAENLLHLRLNAGDLWVLAAMVAWAVYTVCLRWRPRELSSGAFTGTLIALGVAVLVPLFAWDYSGGARTEWNWRTFAAVAYYGIFPSVLAYFFWNSAVARVGSERAGTFLHLMPVFGAVLAWLLLGEALLWYHFAGAALIFCGLFIATARGQGRVAELQA